MMNWQQAIEVVEKREGQRRGDTELLEAAQVLVAKLRRLTTRKVRMVAVGEVTLSIKEWAKRSGISDKTIYNRLKRGWTVEDAVSIVSQSDGSKFDGKTLRQWSEECGLGMDTIYARISRGWSIADAVSRPLKPK